MSSYNKLNKFERSAQRQAILAHKMGGKGLYLFRNHTKGELMLPKPAIDGRRKIPANGEFQGDNYFMQYVKNNMLSLVKEITSPEQEKKDKENLLLMEQQKLILDQPDRVTTQGKTEHVVVESKAATKTAKPVNESKGKPATKSAPSPVLINESPADMSGIEIIK